MSQDITSDSPLPIDQVIKAETQAEKTSTSKGEKLFDWLTYGGISGLGVFIAGIGIGYSAKYGKGAGAKAFKGTAEALEKVGLSPKSAEDFAMTSALMIPGNLGLIPVKIMENHKPELVNKFNDMLGDKSHDASVDQDPKQTWASLIKSRVAAWIAVYTGFRGAAMVFGNDKFAAFENKFSENMVCKPLGKPTHIPGLAKIAENETKIFRYGKIAAIDVFATTAATALLYAGTRFFAKKNEKWHPTDLVVTKDQAIAATPQEAPDSAAIVSAETPTTRLFTDSIPSRDPVAASRKIRADNFADSVASQKTEAREQAILGGV